MRTRTPSRSRAAALRFGLALAAAGLIAGCKTGNLEDDAFFNRGWVDPTVLDRDRPNPTVNDSMPPPPDAARDGAR